MESSRLGSGIPSRPLGGPRTRGTGTGIGTGMGNSQAPLKTPRPLNRTTKTGDISARLPKQPSVSQPTKIANPSSRRPSNPSQQTPRLAVNSQPSRNSPTPQPSTRPSINRYGTSGSTSSSRTFSNTSTPGLSIPKPSSLSRPTAPRNDSSRSASSSRRSRGSIDLAFGIHLDRGLTCSPAEIQVAEVVEVRKPGRSPVIYPELDRYRDFRRPSNGSDANTEVPFRLATHDLPPPTPASLLFSGTSGSPSTRFSESPGPGSYSRDTTPTSITSQSPCLISPYRGASSGRLNSPSQTRPPVALRAPGGLPAEVGILAVDPQGLAAVRESLNSSSSNSTVRESEKVARKVKSKKLLPPPPSPPPRKSSQKFIQSQEEPTPPRTTRKPSQPLVRSPSPKRNNRPSPSQLEVSTALPPSRPSRDGAPDLHSQLHSPVPIIHSNLSTQSLPIERRGSDSGAMNSLSPPPPHLSHGRRTASISRLPIGGEVSSRAGSKLAGSTNVAPTQQPRVIRTPSPNVTSSFRFPFFGRKKTSDESHADSKEKGKKIVRKGPAAGTGHEGYGRLGAAKRRSSSTSQNPRPSLGSNSSQDSYTGNDSFLAERISPVIIAGGSVVENRNTSSDISRTDSSQSLGYLSKTSSEMSLSSRQAPQNSLRPSLMSRPRPHISSLRRPSDSSDSEGMGTRPTLALRRSAQRLRSSPDNPLRLPQPINTSGNSSSPMTSFDTSVMSDDSHFDLQREISREPEVAHPAHKKLTKRPRSPRKWNLFGRSSQNQQAQTRNEQVTATVKVVEKKPIPFYAMMDSSEQEDSEPMNVQDALRYAEVYGKSPSIEPVRQSSEVARPSTGSPVRLQRTVTRDNLETKPKAKPRSAMVPPALRLPIKPSGPSNTAPSRPSRLPSVGRIPKVVNNRKEFVSPKSFSRPFRASMQLGPQQKPPVSAPDSIVKGPAPTTPVPELTMDDSTIGSTNVASSRGSIPGLSPDLTRVEKEFIAFSPRKDSEGTIGTSSSSCSGIYAFAEATAVIPKPSDPPIEDEVWDEYNDLLNEENGRGPNSATSSKGIPFHLETYQSRLVKEKPMESPTIILDDRKASRASKGTTASSTYSANMTERLRAAFQPHTSPPTSPCMSDIAPPEKASTADASAVSKPVTTSRRSSQSSRKSARSNASCSSDDGSPLAQVNLRVGSMTVSKWLTFGHVLFSDVRHELVPVDGSLKRHSILVIDGLGNDDWSFYAAETYPAATFFNLSPRAPLPPELKSSTSNFPLSPPNHHQIQYMSHIDKFPFAPHSFTALVYRFPVAAPEAYYRSILNEARRVLIPGGSIELSILDVDLNNMGNRGRRTIRRLKERIRDKTPEANLASTADLIIRLLGKTGFTAIKAARVGVPVASPTTEQQKSKAPVEKKRDQPSLAEMMSDSSPLADEGITKMVSRVGRWWYTRCYENAAENPSDRSIWSDRALLSECQELGTSLKLTVCCARAPLERVTSV